LISFFSYTCYTADLVCYTAYAIYLCACCTAYAICLYVCNFVARLISRLRKPDILLHCLVYSPYNLGISWFFISFPCCFRFHQLYKRASTTFPARTFNVIPKLSSPLLPFLKYLAHFAFDILCIGSSPPAI